MRYSKSKGKRKENTKGLRFIKFKFLLFFFSFSENMAKKVFQPAIQRLFHRVFVCRVCKTKMRADPAKVREGKVKCRKCGSRALRPKKRPL